MKTLRQIRSKYVSSLASLYGEAEALSLFYWAVEEILHLNRMGVGEKLDEPVKDDMMRVYYDVLGRLKAGEPIQYVFGKAYFAGLELFVSPMVLIPRPETEELYRWAVEELRGMLKRGAVNDEHDLRIMDLCTGSGALAIALSKAFPMAEVYACDVWQDIIEVAERNDILCGTSVQFFRYNVLRGRAITIPHRHSRSRLKNSFHLIVSNPPYVRPCEKIQMRKNVLEHEPALALYVPEEDPLVFYRAIAGLSGRYLVPGGVLMEEINEAFPEENRKIMEDAGLSSVEIRKDLQGKFRMIRGVL